MGLFDKPRPIVRAKIIGVRSGEDTRGLTTYNFGVYSFLVLRDDGTRDVIESQKGDKNWDVLIGLVPFE